MFITAKTASTFQEFFDWIGDFVKQQSYTWSDSFSQSIVKLLMELVAERTQSTEGFNRVSLGIFPYSDFWNFTSSISTAFSVILFRFTQRQDTDV